MVDPSIEDGLAEGVEEGEVSWRIRALEHVTDFHVLAFADPATNGGFVFEVLDDEVLTAIGGGKEALGKDADEVIGDALASEIRAAVDSQRDAIWEVLWNQVAYGRPLTWMKSTAGVQRLFKTASIEKFEGVVHEGAIMRGGSRPVTKFRSRLLHCSRETVHGSLLKLAQYVQHGAAKRAAVGKKGGVLRGFASAFAIFLERTGPLWQLINPR